MRDTGRLLFFFFFCSPPCPAAARKGSFAAIDCQLSDDGTAGCGFREHEYNLWRFINIESCELGMSDLDVSSCEGILDVATSCTLGNDFRA